MNKLIPYAVIGFLTLVVANYFFTPKERYLNHTCELQKTGHCVVKDKGVELDFTISPLPINPLSALEYTASFKDSKGEQIPLEKVNLRILGHDMVMQEELYFPLEKKENSYWAKLIFPTCTEQLMTWRLYLDAQTKEGPIKATFDIQVSRHTPYQTTQNEKENDQE